MQTIAFHKKCARSDRDWYVSHQPVLVHLLINILIIIMYVNRNVSIAFLSMKFILTSATGFRFTSREILCSTNTEHMQLDIKHSSMYQQNEQLFNKLQRYKYVWNRWENLTIIIIWKQNIFIESCCVLYEQIIILKSLDLICAMRVTFVQHHYTRLFYNPLAIVVKCRRNSCQLFHHQLNHRQTNEWEGGLGTAYPSKSSMSPFFLLYPLFALIGPIFQCVRFH